jgi:VWFA-related protein
MTEALLSELWVQKLGWTLLHFLWQGTAIAVVYAVIRRLSGRSLSAPGRYALACLALTAMAVTPPITFLLIPQGGNLPTMRAIQWNIPASAWQWMLPGFVAVWATGVLMFSIRFFGGWQFTRRLRSASYRAPAEWQRTLEEIAASVMTSRPVCLVVSSLVEVPMVIGWLRPAILVPVGALTGLPPEQITALLAHELAHIRRHDYIANVAQTVIEAVLFYHPAVWWVSERIRAERELCCDDVAVAASGDALTYARALAQLESVQPPRMKTALAANGGSLLNRVRRLIEPGKYCAGDDYGTLPCAGTAWAMTLLLMAGVGVATIHAAQTSAATQIASAAVQIDPRIQADAPEAAPKPVSAGVGNRVGQFVSHARASLLFDPFLPARLAHPPVSEEMVVPRPESADTRNTFQAIPTPPVLLARTELPPPNSSPMPTLHAEARMVQIEVAVKDSHDRPVMGLTKKDFTIDDTGKLRSIDIFSAENSEGGHPSTDGSAPPNAARLAQGSPPVVFSNRNATLPPSGQSTVIVLDRSGGEWDGLRWARQNVLDLIAKGRSDERIALYGIDRMTGLTLIQDYTTDRELLLRSMSNHVPAFAPAPPKYFPQPYQSGQGMQVPMVLAAGKPGGEDPYANVPRYPSGTLARPDEQPYEDAVEDVRLSMLAIAEHLALVPGRKSVFWVSAGFRPLSVAGTRWNESPDWRKTITALNEADVAVNPIDTTEAANSVWGDNRLVMKQIADETGGRIWTSGSKEALAAGIEDSRITYTVGFYLADGERDGKFHALQLRVNRPGLQLSHRRGYYAGMTDMPDPVMEKVHNAETLETALLNQIDSPAIGITARVDVAASESRSTLNLRMNLDVGTLSLKARGEAWTGRVDELFVELNEQGRTLAKVSDTKEFEFASANRGDYENEGVTWPFSIPLMDGAAKMAIVVRDAKTGHVGSLTVPLK